MEKNKKKGKIDLLETHLCFFTNLYVLDLLEVHPLCGRQKTHSADIILAHFITFLLCYTGRRCYYMNTYTLSLSIGCYCKPVYFTWECMCLWKTIFLYFMTKRTSLWATSGHTPGSDCTLLLGHMSDINKIPISLHLTTQTYRSIIPLSPLEALSYCVEVWNYLKLNP